MEIVFSKMEQNQAVQNLHQLAFGAADSKEKGVVIGELVKKLAGRSNRRTALLSGRC